MSSLVALLLLQASSPATADDSTPACIVERMTGNQTLVRRALVKMSPFVTDGWRANGEDGDEGGIAGPSGCPQQTVTYSSHNFQSGGFIAQGGMVETEIAAVTYTLQSASDFPIRIDRIDALIGTLNPTQQITLQWSILVWDGPPNTGTLVYTITSDGTNPPHIVMSPPTNAVLLQAMVDPGDPDQIVVTNSTGTQKFTVGFRIDQHQQPASSSCPCIPSFPQFGSYPAICCPPPSCCNIFPTVDLDSNSHPSDNWLFARNCPGATGFCNPNGGWVTSQSAGIQHDWNIRVLFTPSGCTAPAGACCLASGSCLDGLSPSACQAQGGTYQGNATVCSSINCPLPTGACCVGSTCIANQTQQQCSAQGGTFRGVNSTCTSSTCQGACCVPSTGNCVFTSPSNCTAANGSFQGYGITCGSIVCFPVGACCLPNGSCVGNQSPSQCQSQGGTFQGHQTTCGSVNCPLPTGACCLGTSCLTRLTENDCTVGFGGVWQGPSSTCGPSTCTACAGDIAPPGGNGAVNIDDLFLVISSWGPCSGCAADVAPPGGNGQVNIDDLFFIISHWGPCP